jgi:HK97 family phage prohead protease
MKTEADFQLESFIDAKAQVSENPDGSIVIEGMASDWGVDDQDELFEPGAFQKGIDNFLSTNPVLLYHHDGGKALGQVLELKENQQGLWMKARIDPPAEGSWAEDVVNKVKRGTVRGLSVAGKFRRRMGADGFPRIYEAGLREISVTPLPVHPKTVFAVSAKAFTEYSEYPAAEEIAGLQGSVNRLEGLFSTLEDAYGVKRD